MLGLRAEKPASCTKGGIGCALIVFTGTMLSNAKARAQLARESGRSPLDLVVSNTFHFEPSNLGVPPLQQLDVIRHVLQVNVL